MNFCDVCGKEVADTATLCPVCGANITPLQTPEIPVQQFVPPQYPAQPTQPQYPTQSAQPQYKPTQPQYPTQSVPQQYPVQQAQQQYNPQYPVQQQYPMQQSQPVYQYPMQSSRGSKAAKILGNISFALGLISIILCWICFVPESGYVLGSYCIQFSIIGIILAAISKKHGTEKKATTGKVLSIISLIVAIITTFLSIVLTVASDDWYYSDYDDDYYYSDYNDYDYDDDWLDYTNS